MNSCMEMEYCCKHNIGTCQLLLSRDDVRFAQTFLLLLTSAFTQPCMLELVSEITYRQVLGILFYFFRYNSVFVWRSVRAVFD